MDFNNIKDKLKAKAVNASLDIGGTFCNILVRPRYITVEMSDGKTHVYNYHFLMCCLIAEYVSEQTVNNQACYSILEVFLDKKDYDEIMLHKSYRDVDELIYELKKIVQPSLLDYIKKALFIN